MPRLGTLVIIRGDSLTGAATFGMGANRLPWNKLVCNGRNDDRQAGLQPGIAMLRLVIPEEGCDVAGTMQDPDDVDAPSGLPVKDHVIAHGQGT